MVKMENAITVDIVKAIVIRNYIKLGEHVKKRNENFYGWLDSAQTFYDSAFAASAATPRSI